MPTAAVVKKTAVFLIAGTYGQNAENTGIP